MSDYTVTHIKNLEDQVAMLRQRAEKAEREHDAALARERRLREAAKAVLMADERGQGIGYTEAMDRLKALADEPEPNESGGWPQAPIRDKPWYSVYQPEPSGYELGPAPGSVERAWQSNEEGRRRAEALKLKPNETSEIRQSLKHAKDSIAQWPEGKLQGIKRPQMAFRTPAGTEPPPDLAPAQMLRVREPVDYGQWAERTCRVDSIPWGATPYFEFRPLLDHVGLPYVSGEGLLDDTKYVTKNASGLCLQHTYKPSLNYYEWVSEKVMAQAPITHAILGDWRESLAKVWREEG